MENKGNSKCGIVLPNKYTNMTIWAGILIAVYPILAPYNLFGISVNWILGILFIICHLLKHMTFPIISSAKSVIMYTMLSMILSLNGLLILQNTRNLINAEIAIVIDLVIYLLLWYYSDIDITMKFANLFGYICCGYAVIQIFATIFSKTVPLGQLPFFEVSSGWVSEVWGFRFNSLFSEPSYFAMYLLPLFIYNLLKNNWKNTILFASFIVLSSSSLGIISMMFVLLLRFMSKDFSLRNKIIFLLLFLGMIVFVIVFMKYVPMLSSFISGSFSKIKDIFDSSSNGGFMEDVRLGGYLNLFGELSVKEQIFGVGNAQLQNYFAEHGVYIYNYSNSFVLSLLDFGLLGLGVFLIFLSKLFCVSRREKSLLFFLVLMIAFAVDSLLFSYRYYWLVYFVLFFNKRRERTS